MATIEEWTDSALSHMLHEPRLLLVEFYARWCAQSAAQERIIQELAQELGQTSSFGRLDVERWPETMARHHVSSIPTLVIFKNGEELSRFVGIQPRTTLETALRSCM